MWKIINLVVFFIAMSASSANVEDFTGELIPVAMYPMPHKECFRLQITETNKQCTCADGKNIVLLEVRRLLEGNKFDKGKLDYPILFTDDTSNLNALLNVKCSCGDEEFPNRMVGKRLNKDYVITYRSGIILADQPNGALVYSRQMPETSELTNFLKTVDELSNRNGGIICSKN